MQPLLDAASQGEQGLGGRRDQGRGKPEEGGEMQVKQQLQLHPPLPVILER